MDITRRKTLAYAGGAASLIGLSTIGLLNANPYRTRISTETLPTKQKFVKEQPDLSEDQSLFSVLLNNEQDFQEKLNYEGLPKYLRKRFKRRNNNDVKFWIMIGSVLPAGVDLESGTHSYDAVNNSIEYNNVSWIGSTDRTSTTSNYDGSGPRYHYIFEGLTERFPYPIEPQEVSLQWSKEKMDN